MTRWTLRAWLGAGLAATVSVVGPPRVHAQASTAPTSIVIVTGGEASVPVPTLMEGPQASVANIDIADQLFLHLAELGPTLITSGDRGFEPLLARSWTRRDSVTLAFDLDPRATWQDGVPVTAERRGFHLRPRARPRRRARGSSQLLRHIASVTAEGERRVVFRYSRPYARAALRRRVSRGAAAGPPARADPAGRRWRARRSSRPRSAAARTGGCGAFRASSSSSRRTSGSSWARRRSSASSSGSPTDADARLNLLLGGEADAMDNIPPPRTNVDRVTADAEPARGHRSLHRRSASCCSTSATRATATGRTPS